MQRTVPISGGQALAQDFEEIFREHSQLIYRTAFSVTGSRQDAEDILQTIFLRLLQREAPVEFKRSPESYLYRAAINLSLNTIRSRKTRNYTNEIERVEAPLPIVERHSDEALQQTLLDAIAKLRPRAVEILILHYEHNYSDTEIAKLLRKSRGTIAVTLYRTRARLKKLMLRAAAGEKR